MYVLTCLISDPNSFLKIARSLITRASQKSFLYILGEKKEKKLKLIESFTVHTKDFITFINTYSINYYIYLIN